MGDLTYGPGDCVRFLQVVLKETAGCIMAQMRTGKCAHPGCNCPVEKGKKYCSDYCESVAERPSIACECGHGECAVGETATSAPTD